MYASNIGMPQSTITSKGQITIPKKIREELDLQPGDLLDFNIGRDGILHVTTSKHLPAESFGILYRPGQESLTPEEMDSGVTDYFRKKYRLE